jgi:hypothetical protein
LGPNDGVGSKEERTGRTNASSGGYRISEADAMDDVISNTANNRAEDLNTIPG